MRTATLLVGICLLLMSVPSSADVITSTAAGGYWNSGATWVGGEPPEAADDVVIAGPVVVGASTDCNDLTVLSSGELYDGPSTMIVLSAGGSVLNQGTVRDNVYGFSLEIGGDLSNEGLWTLNTTLLSGTATRQLSMTPTSTFASGLAFASGAGGDVEVTTPISITGTVDLAGGRMLLGEDCTFTLAEASFSGELLAYGNTMFFGEPWAYLVDCTIDAVVVEGEILTSSSVNFTGGLTVNGIMSNLTSGGSSAVTIDGDLVNNGVITDGIPYSLHLVLTGDLINNGEISNNQIGFQDGGTYHVTSAEDAILDATLFLSEFYEDTLVIETPLTTSNQIALGVGTMILEPGSDLTMTWHSVLWSSFNDGHVIANGNAIQMMGPYGTIMDLEIESSVVRGYFTVGGDSRFTEGVTVVDTLVNRAHNVIAIEVDGLLLNEGLLTENGGAFTVIVHGDAENQGDWDNSLVHVDGETDQAIGAGAGIAVTEFVLVSDFAAISYQWTRDGAPLPGETNSELTLAGVDIGDYGVYRCEGGGGELSRAITISESVYPTGVQTEFASTRSITASPNPFNPTTTISFSASRTEHVEVGVFDVRGRLVAVLADREFTPGRHDLSWGGRNASGRAVASGVYFVQMATADGISTTKAVLAK